MLAIVRGVGRDVVRVAGLVVTLSLLGGGTLSAKEAEKNNKASQLMREFLDGLDQVVAGDVEIREEYLEFESGKLTQRGTLQNEMVFKRPSGDGYYAGSHHSFDGEGHTVWDSSFRLCNPGQDGKAFHVSGNNNYTYILEPRDAKEKLRGQNVPDDRMICFGTVGPHWAPKTWDRFHETVSGLSGHVEEKDDKETVRIVSEDAYTRRTLTLQRIAGRLVLTHCKCVDVSHEKEPAEEEVVFESKLDWAEVDGVVVLVSRWALTKTNEVIWTSHTTLNWKAVNSGDVHCDCNESVVGSDETFWLVKVTGEKEPEILRRGTRRRSRDVAESSRGQRRGTWKMPDIEVDWLWKHVGAD